MKKQNKIIKFSTIILTTLYLCTFNMVIHVISSEAKSETNYVSLSGSHISPFDSWSKAATNIQEAVDAAINGDLVLVTNGTYNGIGHEINNFGYSVVSITNAITVKSINGAEVTIVDGENLRRPFFVGNGVVLDGFTLTKGKAGDCSTYDYINYGGGVACMKSGTIINCIAVSNYACGSGGGIYCHYGGTVVNCRVFYNRGNRGSGGISATFGGFVSNCFINGNSGEYSSGGIGIVNGMLIDSVIINNFVTDYDGVGGGIGATETVIKRCIYNRA